MKKIVIAISIVCLSLNYSCISVEKAYEKAKIKNDRDVYNTFLHKYPESIYTGEIYNLRVKIDYEDAKLKNNIDDYNWFLSSNSNRKSIYNDEITNLRDEIIKENKKKIK